MFSTAPCLDFNTDVTRVGVVGLPPPFLLLDEGDLCELAMGVAKATLRPICVRNVSVRVSCVKAQSKILA